MKTQHEIDGEHIIEALRLARERVTGDSADDKKARRDKFDVYIRGISRYLDTGQDQPSSAELRELLGDPDDKAVRDALAHWD